MEIRITWTRKAMSLPPEARTDLERRIDLLHKYFPEMKREMKIGITRSYDGLAYQSDEGFVKLMVDIHRSRMRRAWRMPTYWTLGHEMMHLAQFNNGRIPGGERACDMYALSRLATELIDDSPSYLVVPPRIRKKWRLEHAQLAHDLAKEALERRSKGLKRYMIWWEDEFEKRAPRLPRPAGRRSQFGANLLRTTGARQKAFAPLDVPQTKKAKGRKRD